LRWIPATILLALLTSCSLVDRQGEPEILDLRTDRGTDPTVGRSHKVEITLVTSDPDNDELDFRWIASGGEFEASRRDTLVDLFQDSVKVMWVAPEAVGDYDLTVEVSDGKSGEVASTSLRVSVTQGPPTARAGDDVSLAYADALRVVLDGGQSTDPDGDALRYRWTQIGGPQVAFSEGSASPEFPATAPADYVFVLQVTDDLLSSSGAASSAPDTVAIRVTDRGGWNP